MLRMILCLTLITFPLIAAEPDAARAAALFHEAKSDPAKYTEAAALFAKAAKAGPLPTEQTVAWAYCRLRLAAESWNASKGDAATAIRIITETQAAMDLVPEHAELQKFGTNILTAAGAKPKPTKKATPADGWFAHDSDNFKVRYPAGAKAQVERVLKAAEEQRAAIYTRWSGPPPAAWSVRCEIVLHATADEFATATQQPREATGHALVKLDEGMVTLRRIDLRSDDAAVILDALPRELTHIILADLFPTSPPPAWAAAGMAALAMSAETQAKYTTTAAKLAQNGKLPQAVTLLEATGPGTEVTPFAVGSLALAEFLVQQKGERSLTVFLRDSKRYGLEKSLERQFGFTTTSELDQQWRKQMQK